jgi:serine/threonine-protein kinase RsbT
LPSDRVVTVTQGTDINVAREAGRALAAELGFGASERVLIATAISEVARNIVEFAGSGEVELATLRRGTITGISIIARDRGPGIDDVEAAMRDGFTTGSGLGLGLPGSRRLMDEFEITSGPGDGTTVTMRKWLR